MKRDLIDMLVEASHRIKERFPGCSVMYGSPEEGIFEISVMYEGAYLERRISKTQLYSAYDQEGFLQVETDAIINNLAWRMEKMDV